MGEQVVPSLTRGERAMFDGFALTRIFYQTQSEPGLTQTWLQMTVVICNCSPWPDNRRYAGAQLMLTLAWFLPAVFYIVKGIIFFHGNMF